MKHNSAAAVVVVIAILVLVALPVLYVASVGPAVLLASRGMIQGDENSFAARFYSPLSFVHSNCEPARQALDWYVSLWDSPAGAPRVPTPTYSAPTPSPTPLPPNLAPAGGS
jgi:hypothetical protein